MFACFGEGHSLRLRVHFSLLVIILLRVGLGLRASHGMAKIDKIIKNDRQECSQLRLIQKIIQKFRKIGAEID